MYIRYPSVKGILLLFATVFLMGIVFSNKKCMVYVV